MGRKGKRPRGPRRRHPKALRRDVQLKDAPVGVVIKCYETRTIHDIVAHAGRQHVLCNCGASPMGKKGATIPYTRHLPSSHLSS